MHQQEQQVGQPAAEALEAAEAATAAAAEATAGRGHDLPAAFKRVSCIGGVLRVPNE